MTYFSKTSGSGCFWTQNFRTRKFLMWLKILLLSNENKYFFFWLHIDLGGVTDFWYGCKLRFCLGWFLWDVIINFHDSFFQNFWIRMFLNSKLSDPEVFNLKNIRIRKFWKSEARKLMITSHKRHPRQKQSLQSYQASATTSK